MKKVFSLSLGCVPRHCKWSPRVRHVFYPPRDGSHPPALRRGTSPLVRSIRARSTPGLILIRTLIVRPIRRTGSRILCDPYAYYACPSLPMPTYLPTGFRPLSEAEDVGSARARARERFREEISRRKGHRPFLSRSTGMAIVFAYVVNLMSDQTTPRTGHR